MVDLSRIHKSFSSSRQWQSYQYLLQWLFIAILAGFLGSLCVKAFMFLYHHSLAFILQQEKVPLFIWPLFGAVIVGMLVYRLEPRAMGEGIPSYLRSIRKGSGRLSARETFFKFWAALFTLGTLGSGGVIGPLSRVVAGIMSLLYRWIPRKLMPREHLPLFAICGLAAAFGAMTHSSIGAGIFAVEIIQKANMRYRQLFPSILASTASVFFSRMFGFSPVLEFRTVHAVFDIHIIGLILLVTLCAGFAGKGYIWLYSKMSQLFMRHHKEMSPWKITLRMMLGSGLAFFIAYGLNPDLLGASEPIFNKLFHGALRAMHGRLPENIPVFVILLLLMSGKVLSNALTVGSGMSAGFAGPSMLSGLLIGATFAHLFHIVPASANYYALLAAGLAGMFSSMMNTPIATGILTIELFGLYYSLPAGIAAVIGFQINRHNTLYDTVLEGLDEE